MANTTRMLRFSIGATTLFLLGLTTACTTDDSDPAEDETGGTSGTGGNTSGTGGATGGSSTGGASTGGSSGTGGGKATKCASPITLASTAPGIANFDTYSGNPTDLMTLQTWSFPFGGDSSSGIISGTFVYGDHMVEMGKEVPELSAMVDGHDSMYALSISDTEAEDYGGGMGLWMTACLDATAFSGISFWVRGNAPNSGQAALTILMEETTSSTPSSDMDAIGTCDGIDEKVGTVEPTCKPPKATFQVTDTWTEIQLPWSRFAEYASPGKTVTVDGHNIWQLQFDIGLFWDDDGTGMYVPTPAPYELVVDSITFY